MPTWLRYVQRLLPIPGGEAQARRLAVTRRAVQARPSGDGPTAPIGPHSSRRPSPGADADDPSRPRKDGRFPPPDGSAARTRSDGWWPGAAGPGCCGRGRRPGCSAPKLASSMASARRQSDSASDQTHLVVRNRPRLFIIRVVGAFMPAESASATTAATWGRRGPHRGQERTSSGGGSAGGYPSIKARAAPSHGSRWSSGKPPRVSSCTRRWMRKLSLPASHLSRDRAPSPARASSGSARLA